MAKNTKTAPQKLPNGLLDAQRAAQESAAVAAPLELLDQKPVVTPESLTVQAQKSLEDLYFSAAGIATDALEGFLDQDDRHYMVEKAVPFSIFNVTKFEGHKAPFGVIDGWNIKARIDVTGTGPKMRTLSLVSNAYRDAFFTVIAKGVNDAGGEGIGPWVLAFFETSSGQEAYDVRPYHLRESGTERVI